MDRLGQIRLYTVFFLSLSLAAADKGVINQGAEASTNRNDFKLYRVVKPGEVTKSPP